MSSEQLGWLSVVVTVVLGVGAFLIKAVVNKNRQNQRIDRGGSGIQAGGDVKIGKHK